MAKKQPGDNPYVPDEYIENLDVPAEAALVVALALENLPAGAPLIVKPDGRARLAEADELYRANAVAPFDVPEGAQFEVEVK